MERSFTWMVPGIVIFLTQITYSVSQSNETHHYVCPKNFHNVGRKCYHFSNGTGSWFQSYYNCQEKELSASNLTVFTDRYDQRQMEHFLFRNKSRSRPYTMNSFWVGGFKDWKQKKWIYTDGSLMQFPSPKELRMSEEDQWTCLLVDGTSKSWRAENCMKKHPFICETKVVASVELKLVDKKVKRKISIDDCISNPQILSKKQQRKCQKMLNGIENNHRDIFNEPAAVIQPAKPAYPTQPTSVRVISHICPQNWMSLGKQCYLFSKEKVTWIEAHFNCGQINAKLAIVKSKAQDQKLRIFLNGFTEKEERWIGGRYNQKTLEWTWALNGKPLNYRGFFKEAASNSTESLEWQAIVMDPRYGFRWSHRNQMEKHLYICQVKGRAVKRLTYPRRPAATIEIIPDRRFQRRNQQDNRLRIRSNRRANRNKRT